MGDDKTVLRKMRLGQVHGAVLTAGGLVQTYKDITLYNLPMLFRDEAEADYVRAQLDAKLLEGLARKKFIGFGFAEVGFAYPMLQSPATSVAEVRQRKVWVPDNDPGALQAFAAFRVSPIPLPIADVLAGLQTGLIDSIASPPVGTIALQWHTQVAHAVDLPLLYVYGLLAMAERPFGRLTREEQQIVREEMGAAVQSADASARRDHTSAKAALVGQGVAWDAPSESELAEWRSLAEQARNRMVSEGFISQDLYQQLQELLAQHRATAR